MVLGCMGVIVLCSIGGGYSTCQAHYANIQSIASKIGDFSHFFGDFEEISALSTYKSVIIRCEKPVSVQKLAIFIEKTHVFTKKSPFYEVID